MTCIENCVYEGYKVSEYLLSEIVKSVTHKGREKWHYGIILMDDIESEGKYSKLKGTWLPVTFVNDVHGIGFNSIHGTEVKSPIDYFGALANYVKSQLKIGKTCIIVGGSQLSRYTYDGVEYISIGNRDSLGREYGACIVGIIGARYD